MDDLGRSWFDDADDVERDDDARMLRRGDGRRRVHLLLVAAALPWLLVAAMVVRGGGLAGGGDPIGSPPSHAVDADGGQPGGADAWPPSDPDPTAGEATPNPGAPTTDDGGRGAGGQSSTAGAEPGEGVVAARRPAAEGGDVGAVAVLVARAWLTGMDPVLSVEGIEANPGSYAEHLVIESVERLGDDAAVVRIGAIVLEADGGTLVARARRLAVPLTVKAGGPRPAGVPWWLPEPDLGPVVLDHAEVEDQALRVAAADAVAAAGYEDVALVGLHRTNAGPWLAEVRARTPAGAPLNGAIWLREHPDGFVVAGAAASSSPSEEEPLP